MQQYCKNMPFFISIVATFANLSNGAIFCITPLWHKYFINVIDLKVILHAISAALPATER
jgi:hypothetical protein